MQTSGTSCTNQAQGQEEVQKYLPRKGYMRPVEGFSAVSMSDTNLSVFLISRVAVYLYTTLLPVTYYDTEECSSTSGIQIIFN